MKNKIWLGLLYEFLWLLFAVVAAFALVFPVITVISSQFKWYLIASIIFIVMYFHFIAFLRRSILLENVWMKLFVFLLNIPFFFFLLDAYYEYGRAFDEYNFTLPANIYQHIKSGTELEDLVYIKHLVTFAGIASLTVLILLEIRIIIAIFTMRQLDKIIYRNKR